MNKVYLLIGGNMGDRMANLELALNLIEQHAGQVIQLSSVYETAAWGNTNQAHFLNQAVFLHTPMEADALMNCLLSIESTMGRERNIPLGPRNIDIDIIYFNDAVLDTELLKVPHPRLANRRFVLLPLAEIAPEYMHPILGKSNASLLLDCDDPLFVHKK